MLYVVCDIISYSITVVIVTVCPRVRVGQGYGNRWCHSRYVTSYFYISNGVG